MLKKSLYFIVLFLTILNIPEIVLELYSIQFSSPLSYLLFFLLGIVILIENKKYPKEIVFLGLIILLYFFISSIKYFGPINELFFDFIKSLLFLFGLYSCINNIDKKSLFLIIIIGASTIIFDLFYFRFNDFVGENFTSEFGRYSGFYLNPNTAAILCLYAYVFSLSFTNYLKYFSVFFTFLGILTLSRSFFVGWVLVSSIYLFLNKNLILKSFFFIALIFLGLIYFGESLRLDLNRFDFLTGLFRGNIDYQFFLENNRVDTWIPFFGAINDSPIIGNGYSVFKSSLNGAGSDGVHNTFLLLFGEAGIITLLLFMYLIFLIFRASFRIINQDCIPFLYFCILFITLSVSHNFFDSSIQLLLFVLLINILNKNKYSTTT